MNKVSLLDASMGIQSILDAPDTARLPESRQMVSTVLRPLGIEGLYTPSTLRSTVEAALHPAVGDGEVLRPEEFSSCIRSCATALRHAPEAAARELVEKELDPLLENKDLLQAYTGLMIGG